jgi:hypothetical protein
MDAKLVDLCFAGVVELGYLPFPCRHAGLSPMWLEGSNYAPRNFDVGRKSISGSFPVSSTATCGYSGYRG